MFTTSMIEKEKDIIEIKDIPKDGLDSILKFIYTNNINITSKNINDILHAATLLQVGYESYHMIGFYYAKGTIMLMTIVISNEL